MKRSREKRSGLWLLILLLAACSGLKPGPVVTLPSRLVPAQASTSVDVPGGSSPTAALPAEEILSLASQPDRLWIGTREGVWQIDPQTRQLLRHNDELRDVGQLLPIEQGQAWAVGSNGLFFFDGQAWRLITLPDGIKNYSDNGGLHTLALDAAGDLWLISGAWRGVHVFRLHGHTPAETTLALSSDTTNVPDFWEPDCDQVPRFAAGYRLSYQSSEECRALQAARPTVSVEPYLVIPLTRDAHGYLWWAQQNTLQHSLPDVIMPVSLPGRVNVLESDPARGVWVGTDAGLFYTDGHELHQLLLTPAGQSQPD